MQDTVVPLSYCVGVRAWRLVVLYWVARLNGVLCGVSVLRRRVRSASTSNVLLSSLICSSAPFLLDHPPRQPRSPHSQHRPRGWVMLPALLRLVDRRALGVCKSTFLSLKYVQYVSLNCSFVCLIIFYHPRMQRGNVFSRTCLCVCLSVCNALTAESLQLES